MSAMVGAILIPVGLSRVGPHKEQFIQGNQQVLGTSEVIGFTPPFTASSTNLFATSTPTTTPAVSKKIAKKTSTGYGT